MISAESVMVFKGQNAYDWQIIVEHVKIYQDAGYKVDLYPLVLTARVVRTVEDFHV